MAIDFKNFIAPAMDINRGKVKVTTVTTEVILASKVDRECSLATETPCYLVGQTCDGESVSQKWVKNGQVVSDERELSNNKIILPMSQWEEEE